MPTARYTKQQERGIERCFWYAAGVIGIIALVAALVTEPAAAAEAHVVKADGTTETHRAVLDVFERPPEDGGCTIVRYEAGDLKICGVATVILRPEGE